MPSRSGNEKHLRHLMSIMHDVEGETEGAAPLSCGSAGCDPDETAILTMPGDTGGRPAPGGFEPLWAKLAARAGLEERRAGEDRSSADALYDELMSLDARGREHAIDHDERFASFALAERLLGASQEVREHDRQASLELARLGLDVADRLGPPEVVRGLVADLKARAWAYLGDGWHAGGQSLAAEEAFRLAQTHLRRGSGDLLEEAEIAVLLAAAESDPEVASERLDRASEIYVAAGERLRLGEVAASKARVAARNRQHQEAAELRRSALRLMRGQASNRRLAEVGIDLARSLQADGKADEAWTEIARARSLLAEATDAELESHLRWVEGRVVGDLGLAAEAERHFEAARRGFLAAGRATEAARVQLDLAALLAERRGDDYRPAMARLIGETGDLLASGTFGREAVSSLLLIRRAAERSVLTPGLAYELSALLERVA